MKQFNLEDIKRAIVEKFNWVSPNEWTNFHFKELSKAIEDVTGDRISEETLKRIFGKRKVDSENYQPQAFSQMALMKFAKELNQTKSKEAPFLFKLKKNKRTITASIFIIITTTILLLSLLTKSGSYSFSCENSVDFYPFTATFNYDISEIHDSVFAKFSNDQETYLPPERTLINYFYQNTGLQKVLFYTRSKILDSLDIIVNSRDWQGGFFPNNEPELYQPFLNQSFFRQKNNFYASPDKLLEESVDLKQKFYTAYKYFTLFNKSLDSLSLETRLLNNEMTGSYLCYDIGISLVGEHGLIDFKFTQPKCSRHANMRISEKHFDGEYNDLSALSVDMSDWLQIKMITKSNHFNLYLSNELILSEEYEKPLGNLLGVVFYFFGSGKIDHLKLADINGKTFYLDDFSQ